MIWCTNNFCKMSFMCTILCRACHTDGNRIQQTMSIWITLQYQLTFIGLNMNVLFVDSLLLLLAAATGILFMVHQQSYIYRAEYTKSTHRDNHGLPKYPEINITYELVSNQSCRCITTICIEGWECWVASVFLWGLHREIAFIWVLDFPLLRLSAKNKHFVTFEII